MCSGFGVGCVPQPESISRDPPARQRASLRSPAVRAGGCAASLRLQQHAARVGSCVVSLADKLYGNASSLSGAEPGSAMRLVQIDIIWLGLNAEGSGEGLAVGFVFGGSGGFKSLRFARQRGVWFVMWMEGGVGSPSLRGSAFPALPDSVSQRVKPALSPCCIFPRAALTSPRRGGRERRMLRGSNWSSSCIAGSVCFLCL